MRNLLLLLLLIVLAITAYFLYTTDGKIQSQVDFKDFSIEDTAGISKIFISDINGNYVSLNKEASTWKINNNYAARPDAIGLILKTVHDIKIKSPISKTKVENVLKRMASNSVKVEFYGKDNTLIKTWYVGDPTPSRVGTYMLLEKNGKKSSKAYVTHLLTEKGSLKSRFFRDSLLWRDRIILKTNPQKIKSIEVIHSVDSNISFKITNQNNTFMAENLNDAKQLAIRPEIAIPFFKKFKGIYYEYLDNRTPAKMMDSIKNSSPRHIVNIEMLNGDQFKLKTFFMPVRAGATMDNGEPVTFNPERMYAFCSEMDSEVNPIVQNLTFDPLVPSLKSLTESTNVDK